MEIIKNRREAVEKGLVKFDTGKPCKWGHMAPRFTSSGGCVECVNPKRREPGSGMKWLTVKYAVPDGVHIPLDRAAELDTLIRGWVEFKLREWALLAPTAPRRPMFSDPGQVKDVDGQYMVCQIDGSWINVEGREAAKVEAARVLALCALG